MRRTFWNIVILFAILGVTGIATAQLRPGRGGGGGASGVGLQSTSPGSAQTGNMNITGTAIVGSLTAGSIASPSTAALIVTSGNLAGTNPLYRFNTLANVGTQPWNNSQPFMEFQGQGSTWMSIRLGRIDLSPLNAGNTSIWSCPTGSEGCITARNLAFISSGTAIVTDTAPFAVAATNPVLNINNNGASRFRVNGDGTLVTPLPIPQASGGTGAGVLNCAGAPLTSNGTTYSCTTVATGTIQRVTNWDPGNAGTLVSGSLCVTSVVNITGIGALGNVCVINPRTPFGTRALTISCEILGAGSMQFRWCNTGTNDQNVPPAGSNTYDIAIIQ